jgi:ketosteroid isomerase-like protein
VSKENVELVRKLFEVYNERSFVENADLIDLDIVWDVSRVEFPDALSYTGRQELLGFAEAWEDGFVAEHVEAREIFDAGDDVIAMVHHRGRGKTSGIEITQTFAMVWTLKDGRAVKVVLYPTLEEAREAVGVRDEDLSA